MIKNKFSLIIGTLDRSEYLAKCLDYLAKQTYQNYEVIIVDQSPDNKTQEFVQNSKFDFKLYYKHIDIKGLSHARNIALEMANGDYICLIDDDGAYSQDYLLNLNAFLNKMPNAIVAGKIWNPRSKTDFVNYKGFQDTQELSLRQIIRNCPSPGLTIPAAVFKKIGNFDERFGVGSKFGAGEETDVLLRAYIEGYRVYFLEKAKLDHPLVLHNEKEEPISLQKAYNYSVGIGAMYTKFLREYHMKSLLPMYIERHGKLLAKHVIGNPTQRMESSYQLRGTKKGIQEYLKTMKK